MITQAQYERLCELFEGPPRVGREWQDVADLLESFEQLYEALDRCAASGARALQQKDFELLVNDYEEPTVRLKKASGL